MLTILFMMSTNISFAESGASTAFKPPSGLALMGMGT